LKISFIRGGNRILTSSFILESHQLQRGLPRPSFKTLYRFHIAVSGIAVTVIIAENVFVPLDLTGHMVGMEIKVNTHFFQGCFCYDFLALQPNTFFNSRRFLRSARSIVAISWRAFSFLRYEIPFYRV